MPLEIWHNEKGAVLMMDGYVDSLTSWEELEETFDFTQEEWDEIDLKVQIVGEIINARQNQELTQTALEELSGVRQPVIARLETNTSDPQLTTILKILRPLGKTLAVVDMPATSKKADNTPKSRNERTL